MAEPVTLKEQVRAFLREHPEVLAEELPRILKDYPHVLEDVILSILPKIIVDHVDFVIKKLPEVIEKYPEIKRELYIVLSKEYVTKEEIKKILDEMREQREDFNRQFIEQREELRRLREDFNRHREDSNRRFEQQAEELRQLREDTNRRFEALIQEMKIMKEDITTMKKDIATAKEDIITMKKDIAILSDKMDATSLSTGRFTERGGHRLEDAIAGALRYILKRRDIYPENVHLRVEVVDEEGIAWKKGKKKEIDLYITNDEAIIVEIKSSAKWYEIEDFADKAEVAVRYLKLEGRKITKVLISLDRHPSVVKACKKHNIIFLWDEKLEKELRRQLLEEEIEPADE